jgi:DNA-3-methyladenine glycosylase
VIPREFFTQSPVECARALVGCEIVWGNCRGLVVECEAYAAVGDPACHTFSRPSAREFVARHQAGAAYVYLNYGMHWMLNVLVKGGTEDGFVLFRAIEPTVGIAAMTRRRASNFKVQSSKLKTPSTPSSSRSSKRRAFPSRRPRARPCSSAA